MTLFCLSKISLNENCSVIQTELSDALPMLNGLKYGDSVLPLLLCCVPEYSISGATASEWHMSTAGLH